MFIVESYIVAIGNIEEYKDKYFFSVYFAHGAPTVHPTFKTEDEALKERKKMVNDVYLWLG